MPARHRERYSNSLQKLSTITPEFCPRCAGISVHVDLETLSTVSRNTHFPHVAIFRPGIIVGNAHTPRWVGWLGKLVPGPGGNIEQRDIGKAFVAEIAKKAAETGLAFYDNQGMRKSIADFTDRLFAVKRD